jgi:hypothetical protein
VRITIRAVVVAIELALIETGLAGIPSSLLAQVHWVAHSTAHTQTAISIAAVIAFSVVALVALGPQRAKAVLGAFRPSSEATGEITAMTRRLTKHSMLGGSTRKT